MFNKKNILCQFACSDLNIPKQTLYNIALYSQFLCYLISLRIIMQKSDFILAKYRFLLYNLKII